MGRHTPAIPILRKQRQEDPELGGSLNYIVGYIVSSRLPWSDWIIRLYLKLDVYIHNV